MGPRRTWLVLLVAVLVLSSCGRGGGKAYSATDLPAILLQPSEAPEGTAYAEGYSGPQPLETFARDDAELRSLRADGFRAAYVAYFPPEAFFERRSVPPDAVAMQVIAVLFEEPDGASSTMKRFVGDVRERQLRDATYLPASGLGDESFGLKGRAAVDGSPLVVYVWRAGNLVLVASGSRPIPAEEVRALAGRMQARASWSLLREGRPNH